MCTRRPAPLAVVDRLRTELGTEQLDRDLLGAAMRNRGRGAGGCLGQHRLLVVRRDVVVRGFGGKASACGGGGGGGGGKVGTGSAATAAAAGPARVVSQPARCPAAGRTGRRHCGRSGRATAPRGRRAARRR